MKRQGLLMVAVFVMGVMCLACAEKSEVPVEPEAVVVAAEAVVATQELTATVTQIDQATRKVTLTTEDGQEYDLVVDDAVKNLAQVQAGDVVTATYTEAFAYEVIKGGLAADAETTAVAAAAELGEMPEAVVARETTVTVTITAIDASVPTVTFLGPAGNSRVIRVKYPEKLEGVNVGDSVVITYAEALAMSVEKAPTE